MRSMSRLAAARGWPAWSPFLAMLEQERLRRFRAHRRLARRPFIVVQIHVGVVFDVAAKRAVEVPEPVGAVFVPPGAPKRLIAGFDEARACEHQLGRPTHVEREMFAALHERWRLDEEQR